MSRFPVLLACLAILMFGLGLAGCNAPADSSKDDHADDDHAPDDHADDDHADDDHADDDHADDDHADDDHDHADDDHADHPGHISGDAEFQELLAKLPAEEQPTVQEAIAQLPEEDQAAAKRQATCPVRDVLLGSGGMGMPYKLLVTGSDGKEHEVFLCCVGCKSKIEGDPDTYLAKLHK